MVTVDARFPYLLKDLRHDRVFVVGVRPAPDGPHTVEGGEEDTSD